MVRLGHPAHPGHMNSAAAVAATAPPTGLPDPGEPVPMLAKPTVALFLGGLVVWGVSTWARLALGCPLWLGDRRSVVAAVDRRGGLPHPRIGSARLTSTPAMS
jgi:hypothetical protein